jgi:hypothetical protein
VQESYGIILFLKQLATLPQNASGQEVAGSNPASPTTNDNTLEKMQTTGREISMAHNKMGMYIVS